MWLLDFHDNQPKTLQGILCLLQAACTFLVLVQAELSKMERMSTVATTETRNDLHLTSTGISHAIRDTVPSPQINV